MGITCFEIEKKKKVHDDRETNVNGDEKDSYNNNYEINIIQNQKKKDKKKKKKDELSQVQNQHENKSSISSEKVKKMNSIYDIYDEVLEQHNKVRKDLDIRNLSLNDELTILAQKFADNYDSSEESNFIIDNYNNQNLGINYEIFQGDISKINKICDSWIIEGFKNKKIISNNNKYASKTKHFSQIISKNTKEIGIGYSELNNKEKILIVYYYPAGDILK